MITEVRLYSRDPDQDARSGVPLRRACVFRLMPEIQMHERYKAYRSGAMQARSFDVLGRSFMSEELRAVEVTLDLVDGVGFEQHVAVTLDISHFFEDKLWVNFDIRSELGRHWLTSGTYRHDRRTAEMWNASSLYDGIQHSTREVIPNPPHQRPPIEPFRRRLGVGIGGSGSVLSSNQEGPSQPLRDALSYAVEAPGEEPGVDRQDVSWDETPYYLDMCWRCGRRVDRDDEVGLCDVCKNELASL